MLTFLSGNSALVTAIEQEVKKDAGKLDAFWNAAWPVLLNFAKLFFISLVIWLVGKRLIKLIMKITNRALTKANAEQGVKTFLNSLIRIVLYAVLVMLIAGNLGVETSSVIALVGSAGLTIGLALQGSLSNFAGGVLILLLKPFKVGDYISANGHEGTVTSIDIFYTKLTTVDNRAVVLPNGTLSNSSIVNVTKEPFRRIDLTASVAYESDIRKVKNLLQKLAGEQKRTIQDEAHPIQVFVDTYGDSAINLGLRFWVKAEDYWDTRWEVTERMKEVFDENQISIPFNQLDVMLKKN